MTELTEIEEYSTERVVDTFLDHVRYLKVKHHVNGRIRVKANWSGAKKLASMDAGELESIIASIPGVGEYRVNKKALSVIINYDQNVLPFSLWDKIGTLAEYPMNREIVRTQILEIMGK